MSNISNLKLLREATDKELMEWTLACQEGDSELVEVVSPKGFGFTQTPYSERVEEREWVSSGSVSSNAWCKKLPL